MLLKNTAGQKLLVFAYDRTTLLGKTGDAANITGYVSLDGAAGSSLGNPTEIDATNMPGWYYFAPSQAQTNGDAIAWSASSATTNIGVDGGAGYTTAAVPADSAGVTTLLSRISQTVPFVNIGGTQYPSIAIVGVNL
jgi:hypothetical protein